MAPFPGPGQPIKVTLPRINNDVNWPLLSPDMTALYCRTYIPDYEIRKIKVRISDNTFPFEPESSFFNGGNRFATGGDDGTEIHPNGDRFLIGQLAPGPQGGIEPCIKVIVNWEQELEGS